MPNEVDYGDLGLPAETDREVRTVLSQWERERQRLCQERMRAAAKEGGERRLLHSRDGNGGEVKMMIDPYSYHFWGQRLGYQCWQDATFCREFLRDNPEARVRSVSDRVQAVVAGFAGEVKRRFHKVYGGV